MRITTPQITAMMHAAMSVNSEELGKLMRQMATGERILQPSDDPIASVRILRVQREEASLAQYRSNISNLASNLSKQEVNLKAASDTMQRVQDLLLWAANLGANTSEDLAAMASELSTLEETIVSFANVRDEEGQYLFSGTQSDKEAIVFDGTPPDGESYYVAGGNDKSRQAAVANGVLVEENVTAVQVFGDMKLLNDLHALVQMLQGPSDPALGDKIAETLDSLDRTHRDLLGTITELGGRQNSLSLLVSSNENISLVNQKIEGELSTLDYASASIDFKSYEIALQATQKTYLMINQLSLFSQL